MPFAPVRIVPSAELACDPSWTVDAAPESAATSHTPPNALIPWPLACPAAVSWTK